MFEHELNELKDLHEKRLEDIQESINGTLPTLLSYMRQFVRLCDDATAVGMRVEDIELKLESLNEEPEYE